METVLLAEDEPLVRKLLAGVLRKQGYAVLQAADSEEAVSLIRANPSRRIHLLITDMVMPRLAGPELAEQIRTLRPAIKVLYIFGYAIDSVSHTDSGDPKVEFLQKPFNLDAVVRKVRSILCD